MSRNRLAIQRRVAPLTLAEIEVDALRPRVRLGTRELQISPDEHILLYTLVASAGGVVTYSVLAVALGLSNPVVRNNTIARHVSALRRKLSDDAKRPNYIETVVGIGYGIRVAPHLPLTGEPASPRSHLVRLPTNSVR